RRSTSTACSASTPSSSARRRRARSPAEPARRTSRSAPYRGYSGTFSLCGGTQERPALDPIGASVGRSRSGHLGLLVVRGGAAALDEEVGEQGVERLRPLEHRAVAGVVEDD